MGRDGSTEAGLRESAASLKAHLFKSAHEAGVLNVHALDLSERCMEGARLMLRLKLPQLFELTACHGPSQVGLNGHGSFGLGRPAIAAHGSASMAHCVSTHTVRGDLTWQQLGGGLRAAIAAAAGGADAGCQCHGDCTAATAIAATAATAAAVATIATAATAAAPAAAPVAAVGTAF